MEKISVSFSIQYGAELSQVEEAPMVTVYMDSGVENDPVEVMLPFDKEGAVYEKVPITLMGLYDSRHPLPLYTKVCFYVTCLKPNDHGAMCRVDAGFGAINLVDMTTIPGIFSEDVTLKLYTCDRFEKGKMRITTMPSLINLGPRIKWAVNAEGVGPSQLPTLPGIGRAVSGKTFGLSNGLAVVDDVQSLMAELRQMKLNDDDAEPLSVEKEAMAHIKETMEREMAMPNTDPETGNVRVPIYYGDVGMFRRVPLPAAAFMLFQTPRSNLLFWTNIVEVCLRRDGQNVNDVLMMNTTQKARLMVESCCAVVQALDYIGDLFDQNKRFTQKVEGWLKGSPDVKYDPKRVSGCERFGDALRDGTGDCEDLALAIVMIFTSLLDAWRAGMFSANPKLLYLVHLCEIALQYVPLITLDSVTAAAIKIDEERGKRKLGAHMAVKFLPAIYVKECVERATGQRCVLPFYPFSADAQDLPVLVGEGTGMFECWGIETDPISGERVCVYRNMPSLGFAKKPIVHPPGVASTFYVGSMIALTNYWFNMPATMNPPNLGGLWLGYVGDYSDPSVGPADTFQRGVQFIEMENKSPRMCILPQTIFSDRLMAWMRVATRIRVKPRNLYLTPQGMSAQPEVEPTLEHLVKFAASMGRVSTVQQEPVPVYIRSHQLTPLVTKKLLSDISRLPFITDVRYQCEHLTDWAYCYRTGIHANAK